MSDTESRTETRDAPLVMLDQQLALGAYLQALLRPAPIEAPDEPGPAVAVVEPAPVTVAAEAPTPVAVAVPPAAVASPYPDWAQGEFQCLLFRVAGLTLALPLARLNGVLPWDPAVVTEMPGHQPWFLGLREHLGHQVKLIDVANIVLPPDRYAALPPTDSGRLGKIILIDGGRWGLACDAVAEVVSLAPTDVKWRGQAGNRPWLAGTVVRQMCALIDTEAFAAMLAG